MFADARTALVEWLRAQLIGPAGEEGEVLFGQKNPLERYPTGVLHPIDPGRSGVDAAHGADATPDEGLLDDDGSAAKPAP